MKLPSMALESGQKHCATDELLIASSILRARPAREAERHDTFAFWATIAGRMEIAGIGVSSDGFVRL